MKRNLLILLVVSAIGAMGGLRLGRSVPAGRAAPTVSANADIYLPMLTRHGTPGRIQVEDFQYLGAFRLPGGDERPQTFSYGGGAMTFRPDGDPSGPEDGFPGSLFITGHTRIPVDVPDGSQIAEVSIPQPVTTKNLAQLNRAAFLQEFHIVDSGIFSRLNELPRLGMQYLNTPATGAKIHLAWGQHFQPDDPPAPSHGWFNPDLAAPQLQGGWFIDNSLATNEEQVRYGVNSYMLEIPADWANQHAGGRVLGTGRFRDGAWSGMGPALYAYRPWIDASGNPPLPNAHLESTALLLYASSFETDRIEHCLTGYQHPDEWEGAAWITAPGGSSALLFAGTKATGSKYWYGWRNQAGAEVPCVEQALIGEFTLCRLADGTPCPASDLVECQVPISGRGWWSGRFDAQMILYDVADLAKVAAGSAKPWSPQPYAVLDIDDFLFLDGPAGDEGFLGEGVQRRYRVGDATFDGANGLLYVLELFADGAKPVVHVWRVR